MKENNRFPGIFFFMVAIVLLSCEGKRGDGNPIDRKDQIKYRQYLVEGKRLYLKHCGNCHQENGEGLGRLYPPLKDSDYLKNRENLASVICSVKFGQAGEVIVNGITYNQPMPANPWLTDLEIAEIITYVYSTWGGMEELISYRQAGAALDTCSQRSLSR